MTDDRPPRPDPLEFRPEPVPETLREHDQWVCWRYQWETDRDEWTKVPVDVASGGFASSTDPDTWTSFADAVAYHERGETDTDGLGFVVHEDDLFVGIDVDDVYDPDTGDREPGADALHERVPTYAEVSPSATGDHILGLGIVPDGGNRGDIDGADGHLEMYDSGRYLTVTGHKIDGSPEDVEQVNNEIADVHAEYIADDVPEPEPPKPAGDGGVQADSPDANPGVDAGKPGSGDAPSDLTDDELLERATSAKNGDKFRRLWIGDTAGYESHSEARQALANLLAFWTAGDESRMLRLFSTSDLCRGDDDLRTFKNYEIATALDGRTEFYEPSSTDGPDVAAALDASDASGGDTTEQDQDEDRDLLSPSEVRARLGINHDDGERIDDLSDREKAAVTWQLLRESDEVHVRVRRDNDSLLSYDGGVWKPEGERALRHAARQALGPVAYGKNVLTELTHQARADPTAEIEADDVGLTTGTVAVANGLVDLAAAADGTGDALRDLRPEDYALTRLPVEYDPNAGYDEWADYVDEWAEDGRADALQEYVGYCLHIGAIPIHRALLLVGSGANGKGTFLHVVRALLGRENTTSIELQTLANERDAVADFYGSIANIDDDLSARKLGAGLGMFKKLVAGDRVRARRLYESGFEFDAVGKHLYAANEVPDVTVPDGDEAFWRRWLLVEFPNHYPPSERDPGLRERLTEPDVLSGVLNWAIDGRDRLLEQGYFTNEERYAQAKRERWQAWGESVDKFISECVEHDPDAERLSTQDAHRRYAAWCRENGEDPVGQRELTNTLKNEDVEYKSSIRIDGKVTRGYDALGLSDDVPALDDTPERGDPDDAQQDSLF